MNIKNNIMTHYTKDELKKKTVPILKEICQKHNITINSKMRKDDLINLLCISDKKYMYITDTKIRRVKKMYHTADNQKKIMLEEKLIGYMIFEEDNDIRTEKYTSLNIRKCMMEVLCTNQLIMKINDTKKFMTTIHEQYKKEVATTKRLIRNMNKTQLETYKIGDVRNKLKKVMDSDRLITHPLIFRELCWECAKQRYEFLEAH